MYKKFRVRRVPPQPAATEPLHALHAESDPARRACLALTCTEIGTFPRGQALLSSLAELSLPDAEIVAWYLFPRVLEADLVPRDAIAEVVALVEGVASHGNEVQGDDAQYFWTTFVRPALVKRIPSPAEVQYLYNVILGECTAPYGTIRTLPERQFNLAVFDMLDHCLELRELCVATLYGADVQGWES